MFEIFAKYAGISGIGIGVLLLLYQAIIAKSVSVTQSHSYRLLTLITIFVWLTAMASLASWVYLSRSHVVNEANTTIIVGTQNQIDEKRYIASLIKLTSNVFKTSYEAMLDDKMKTISVEINYPSISKHPDIRIEKKVNELLKKVTGVYRNHKENLLSHTANYKITSLEYNMLSIVTVDEGQYLGAGTSVTDTNTININLENGEIFELKDLFRAGYHEQLLQLIKAKAKCGNENVLFEPTISDTHPFYVNSGKLFLMYDRREICAGYIGPVEIAIDLDSVKSFVNPNGPINYLL